MMAIEFALLATLGSLLILAKVVKEVTQPKVKEPATGDTKTTNALVEKVSNHQSQHNPARSNCSRKNYTAPVLKKKESFRWFDLPYLTFDCLDAPDMTSYSQFASIQDIGKEIVSDEGAQARFLPSIKKQLEEVSIDAKTFRWGKLFAKPDAVFFDKEKNEYLVVEYKSREFYALSSLTPMAVFQLLISADVVRKHIKSRTASVECKNFKVRSFMRLNNKLIEVKGWQAAIQHVLAMLSEVLEARGIDNISASLLARSFVLFDKVFQFKPQSQEDAQYLGRINHIRIAKVTPSAKASVRPPATNIQGSNSTKINASCPC